MPDIKKNGITALVIDDDKWIQKFIDRHLRLIGFDTHLASNPVDGIALSVNLRPDVIFLDIFMPELKGDTALLMLKKIEVTAKIPTIVISGNFEKDLLRRVHKIGAAAFMSKPFKPETIKEKLNETLAKETLVKLKM